MVIEDETATYRKIAMNKSFFYSFLPIQSLNFFSDFSKSLTKHKFIRFVARETVQENISQ